MAFFIHPNQFLLFINDPESKFTPARMKDALAEEGIRTEGKAEPFTLQCGDGPKMFASIVRGTTASFLATRLMGKARKHKALAETCDAYIEIKFESLNEVLDEINTLISVQSSLQKATGGLLYRSWNQSFSGPEE